MPDGIAPDPIEQAVRAVLGSLSGDLTVTEAALLAELEALGREVSRAKSEIAALKVDDITASHIPIATDELDAVVAHTAAATNEILDSCEVLEGLQPRLSQEDAAALTGAVTRIYEACSFQDITGQRIAKVAATLRVIEERVTDLAAAAGRATVQRDGSRPPARAGERPDEDLLNGPQLPGNANSQDDVDALFASL